MWRHVLAVLALCSLVCAVPACSEGVGAKGDGNAKPVENKPGTDPKTKASSGDTTAKAFAE